MSDKFGMPMVESTADEITRLRAELAAIKGQEPDAVLYKDGHAPLEVRISEKHDYGCKLPHGTKFYLHPAADKDAEPDRFESLELMLQGAIAHADVFGNGNVATSVVKKFIAMAKGE